MFNFEHSQITQTEFEKISKATVKIFNSLRNTKI